MSEEYEVWWIDDDGERDSDEVESLRGESDRLSVTFFPPEDAVEKLDPERDDLSEPDLILMDWFLYQKSDFAGTGVSLEGVVRDVFPEVPVYGFSAKSHSKFEAKRGGERFDKLFTLSDLTQPAAAARLISDIEDYNKIEEVKGEGEEALIGLLNPPNEVRLEDLSSALPGEFTGGIPDGEEYESGDVLRFSRWVRDRFLSTPGLVWDKQLTATKLGLKKQGFDEVRSQFEEAEYDGIFNRIDDPGWWKPKVMEVLLSLRDDSNLEAGSPWRSGPEILDVDEGKVAECVVCEEPYPETVGYTSVDSDDGLPVHYRCSSIEKPREGVFDDLRLIERKR